jgi:glutamine amidotransferase
MITIVDYGMGNLGSVQNMFKRIGVQAAISSDIDIIHKASKILLPGVGAFDTAMQKINESGLREVLVYKALHERVPVLGICLGMQLLTEGSDEGKLSGLGLIKGRTHAFRFTKEQNLKVPHMGWNKVTVQRPVKLVENLGEEPRFYFVHAYYVKCGDPRNVILRTTYGIEFDSALQHENISGAQFHPEKSHKFGMRLLENFARL